ncbi:ATP-binding cassette domain-containing protein, partial [Ralstonia pseudosolanacearum]|uniref:ATP-binding cassette domain-containing protein n=1 Tax=Ralstonia pseudosolanacearum TaxID=1310165 RepID=UPI003D269A77
MSWLRRAAVTDAFAQAADAPALALRELRVTMGGRVLIERLSMSAAGGELWCVVGPNGAGKSTLLGVLAGLRAPFLSACRAGRCRHAAAAAMTHV